MKILCVGKVCLDIVNYMDGYPAEDSDQTVPFQRWTQGGNAANNCVVFSHLKSAFGDAARDFEYELFGSFGTDLASDYIRGLLRDGLGVRMHRCPVRDGGVIWAESGDDRMATDRDGPSKKTLLSTSCITVNRLNGTRTIVHARNDVADVDFEDFAAANFDFGDYDWVNFETRDVNETRRMIDHVLAFRASSNVTKPIVSVEIEKHKRGSETLVGLGVDYLFISKDFAQSKNCRSMEEAVVQLAAGVDSQRTTVVCPWGDKGACVMTPASDEPFACPAYRPESAADTLGAGDTFFASFIFGRSQLKKSANDALEFACTVAGLKCGTVGYDGLGEAVRSVVNN